MLTVIKQHINMKIKDGNPTWESPKNKSTPYIVHIKKIQLNIFIQILFYLFICIVEWFQIIYKLLLIFENLGIVNSMKYYSKIVKYSEKKWRYKKKKLYKMTIFLRELSFSVISHWYLKFIFTSRDFAKKLRDIFDLRSKVTAPSSL